VNRRPVLYEGQPERAAQVLWDEIQKHDAAQLLTEFSGIPIDVKFISELLAVGVYWSLFDGFPSKQRDRVAQLWGRMFHLYCADLMRFNYPAGITNPLQFEVPFDVGAADALLDFGTDVVAFEFKGSTANARERPRSDLGDVDSGRAASRVSTGAGGVKALCVCA
jgi:hypothetical protein